MHTHARPDVRIYSVRDDATMSNREICGPSKTVVMYNIIVMYYYVVVCLTRARVV